MSVRLQTLWDTCSADLKRFAPALEGYFGCPICMRPVAPTPVLTDVVAEEHVVPKSLGGRLTTLTCRRCNNSAGSKLESHLVRRVRIDAGKAPSSMRLQVGGAVQRGKIYVSPDEGEPIRIEIVDKQSDPRQAPELERLVKEGVEEMHLSVNSGYIPLRTAVALIRSAYLLMFRTFGYRYVFDCSADVVRDQVADPTRETDVLTGVAYRVNAGLPSETALAIATAPNGQSCFLAVLELDHDSAHMAVVTLPPPGVDGADFFHTLAASGKTRTEARRV